MDKQSSPDIEQQLRNRAGQMPRPFGYSPELQMLVDAANEIARLRASLRSPDGTATTRMPEGLADFARRCRAYLDDCPGDGGHSDAAGSTAYELIEEAIEHCTLPPSIAAAQPSPTRMPDKFDKIADAKNFYDPREAEDYAAKLRGDAAATAPEWEVEVWNGDRKVTVYNDIVLRVWGPNMDTEMSEAPRSHESVGEAFRWLFPDAAQPTPAPYDKMAIEMELFFGLTHFMHDQ